VWYEPQVEINWYKPQEEINWYEPQEEINDSHVTEDMPGWAKAYSMLLISTGLFGFFVGLAINPFILLYAFFVIFTLIIIAPLIKYFMARGKTKLAELTIGIIYALPFIIYTVLITI